MCPFRNLPRKMLFQHKFVWFTLFTLLILLIALDLWLTGEQPNVLCYLFAPLFDILGTMVTIYTAARILAGCQHEPTSSRKLRILSSSYARIQT